MKITVLALSFLLFTFTTEPLPIASTTHDSASNPVLDVNDIPLRPGIKYHIVSSYGGGGGGVSLESIGKKSCPYHVSQHSIYADRGIPVTFSLVNSSENIIREYTPVTIKFNVTTIDCEGSTVWKVDEKDKKTGQAFVRTGGHEGHPSTLFRIQTTRPVKSYALVSCYGKCGVVGIYSDKKTNKRRLALPGDYGKEFAVAFVKADSQRT